jgi:hypothetical protein
VQVRAAGQQPTTTTTLVDDSGVKTASVSGDATTDACKDAKTRNSGAGPDLSCLKLSDVANGAALSGVVSGPGTKLTLAVTPRDAFLWLPFLILLAGIAVAAVVALAPKGLSRLVRRALARLLEENRTAAADKTISGLDGWVATQLASGAEPSKVFSTIAPVVRHGPDHAQSARQSLASALAGDPLGAGHPFAAAAKVEANRSDHRVDDFLSADGKGSRTASGVGVARRPEEDEDQPRGARRRRAAIATTIKPDCRATATRALNVARVTFTRIKSLDDVTDLDGPLGTLTKTIDETQLPARVGKTDRRANRRDQLASARPVC